VFYAAMFEEGVYILHCFVKKTQKTPKKDLELGRQRYKLVLKNRRKAP
jgi:phage-related protein